MKELNEKLSFLEMLAKHDTNDFSFQKRLKILRIKIQDLLKKNMHSESDYVLLELINTEYNQIIMSKSIINTSTQIH